jgi:hypothetical protein
MSACCQQSEQRSGRETQAVERCFIQQSEQRSGIRTLEGEREREKERKRERMGGCEWCSDFSGS